MSNKIVEIIHPNTQIRTFAFNKPVSWPRFRCGRYNKEELPEAAKVLWDRLQNIGPIEGVDLTSYEVRVEIQDGFQDDAEEWGGIGALVIAAITEEVFQSEEVSIRLKNDRRRFSGDDFEMAAE